jgi:hypothetical protein
MISMTNQMKYYCCEQMPTKWAKLFRIVHKVGISH